MGNESLGLHLRRLSTWSSITSRYCHYRTTTLYRSLSACLLRYGGSRCVPTDLERCQPSTTKHIVATRTYWASLQRGVLILVSSTNQTSCVGEHYFVKLTHDAAADPWVCCGWAHTVFAVVVRRWELRSTAATYLTGRLGHNPMSTRLFVYLTDRNITSSYDEAVRKASLGLFVSWHSSVRWTTSGMPEPASTSTFNC